MGEELHKVKRLEKKGAKNDKKKKEICEIKDNKIKVHCYKQCHK